MRIKDGTEYISTCGLVIAIAAYKTQKKKLRREAEAGAFSESLDKSLRRISIKLSDSETFSSLPFMRKEEK
jgi:hypothetical protein